MLAFAPSQLVASQLAAWFAAHFWEIVLGLMLGLLLPQPQGERTPMTGEQYLKLHDIQHGHDAVRYIAGRCYTYAAGEAANRKYQHFTFRERDLRSGEVLGSWDIYCEDYIALAAILAAFTRERGNRDFIFEQFTPAHRPRPRVHVDPDNDFQVRVAVD